MNLQEEFKRKYIGINTVVKNNPHNTQLISARDRKMSQVSKEKQPKKIITTIQAKPKQKTTPQYIQQSEAQINIKAFNFRNLKENPSKRQTDLVKTQQYCTKVNKEYFQKNIKRKLPLDQPQGIQINVNIQNMALLKNKIDQIYETNRKSQRSYAPEEHPSKSRKLPRTSNFSKNQDFQCTQEFMIKKSSHQPKTKLILEKQQPIISRKQFQRLSPQQNQHNDDPQNLIKKFQQEATQINSINEEETMLYLDKRQQAYCVAPYYIEKKQKHFSWNMRATLMEWMMHVSYEFSLSRQTFHIAINLVDLYMSEQSHLSKAQFQLIGATTMFIASKLEEFEPKASEQFANSTNRYSSKEIKETQRKICTKLKYNINPPTLFMWANRFMLQWDQYLDLNYYAINHELFFQSERIYFKKFDEGNSFKNFRILMQLIDCALLDIQTVQYKQKLLVCGFMYLVLGRSFNQFKNKQIVNEFPRSSLYLLDECNLFNDLFSNFLQTSFGIILIDLLPTIQYCATYFILNMNFDPPVADDLVSSEIELEEYCALQTYNPNTKAAIHKRFRGIYE